ncbi:MAG: penicillin-binding transpeptidase domain-containing protein [Verrucomicrobiota bacterium]
MLVFDQLKKNDPQLQLLALVLGGGLFVLLVGLWWVQIVNASRHRETVATQAFRSVRIPAQRGQIYDRNGVVLAENRPSYGIDLYLEELSPAFRKEYQRIRPRNVTTNDLPFWKDWLGFSAVKTNFPPDKGDQFGRAARLRVVASVAEKITRILQAPLPIDPTNFHRHYAIARAMPFPLATDLSPLHVARFEEQSAATVGVDLEIQARRFYPHSNVAAHVIGYVRPDNDSAVGEESFYWYRLPDYRGKVGIEGGLDPTLRGWAGGKSVQINSLLYRQTETIWEPTVPGTNVVLTLDLELQRAAEAALRKENTFTRGAVVVMDVRTGDILALASNPTYSPNQFAQGISTREYAQIQSLGAEKNRATAEHYQAGSVFKTIVALAALETPQAHFNPRDEYIVKENPNHAGRGYIDVGKQRFRDTAPPGPYNLRRAIARSSNAYFIDLGLRPGVFERVVELGRRLHLGERFPTGCLPLRQETGGNFPTAERIRRNWPDGETANISIGQGKMDVTPLQIAVLTSALANGGAVLVPRLIDRLLPNDPTGLQPALVTPQGQIRNELGISKRSLGILRDAMLAETEDMVDGTGTRVQGCGFRVCGKTGTAELDILRPDGHKKNTTWFASFAPYEAPRYAVVVMVEDGVGGGATCAPIAKDVYLALGAFEKRAAAKTLTASTR